MFEPLSDFELQALGLSIKVATAALVICLPLGLSLAMLLARGRFPGRWILEAAINLPLVLPPVVTGLILLSLFGVRGPVGRVLHDLFGVTLAFHWTGAALAATLMALPLAAPGLVAAALLGFARAFGEFGATVTFAGAIPGKTQTLPVAIYSALQRAEGDGAAMRLAVIAVIVSMLAFVGSEICNRRLLRTRGA